jgi:hypothetical protein
MTSTTDMQKLRWWSFEENIANPRFLDPFRVETLSALVRTDRTREGFAQDIYSAPTHTVYAIISLPDDEYISTGDCIVPFSREEISVTIGQDNDVLLNTLVLMVRRDRVKSVPVVRFFPEKNSVGPINYAQDKTNNETFLAYTNFESQKKFVLEPNVDPFFGPLARLVGIPVTNDVHSNEVMVWVGQTPGRYNTMAPRNAFGFGSTEFYNANLPTSPAPTSTDKIESLLASHVMMGDVFESYHFAHFNQPTKNLYQPYALSMSYPIRVVALVPNALLTRVTSSLNASYTTCKTVFEGQGLLGNRGNQTFFYVSKSKLQTATGPALEMLKRLVVTTQANTPRPNTERNGLKMEWLVVRTSPYQTVKACGYRNNAAKDSYPVETPDGPQLHFLDGADTRHPDQSYMYQIRPDLVESTEIPMRRPVMVSTSATIAGQYYESGNRAEASQVVEVSASSSSNYHRLDLQVNVASMAGGVTLTRVTVGAGNDKVDIRSVEPFRKTVDSFTKSLGTTLVPVVVDLQFYMDVSAGLNSDYTFYFELKNSVGVTNTILTFPLTKPEIIVVTTAEE